MNRRALPPLAAACATISLGPTSPPGSSSLPGARRGRAVPCPQADVAPAWPCSRWGLPGRDHCWARRWSLTPPFHPHPSLTRRAVVFCGPVRGFPRPGVARHRALWSADFPRAAEPPTVARPTCLRLHHSRPLAPRQCSGPWAAEETSGTPLGRRRLLILTGRPPLERHSSSPPVHLSEGRALSSRRG